MTNAISPDRKREIAAIRKAAKAAIVEHVALFGMVTEGEMWRFIKAYREKAGLVGLDANHIEHAVLDALVAMERRGMKADHVDAYDPT